MMEFFQTKSYGRGIADFDEFIQKKSHITLRSCLVALCFDPTTLIEIAVYVVSVQSKGNVPTLRGCLLGYFDYKLGSFGSRYFSIHLET